MVEYSQYFGPDGIRPAGQYEIPDVVHGLTAAIAAHQTLLGDALAQQDPKLFAHALLSYPALFRSSPLDVPRTGFAECFLSRGIASGGRSIPLSARLCG